MHLLHRMGIILNCAIVEFDYYLLYVHCTLQKKVEPLSLIVS